MSFVNLATLALHRRNEMEARINVLASKCDHAINGIMKLKLQAQSFVHQLNCESSELKDRFLNCMKQLDEYIYLITDFNLSMGKIEETPIETTPVHDMSAKMLQPTPAPHFNILDVLSEPAPSTSTACPNFCPLVIPKRHKIPKEEQTLIVFSSASCSSESVPLAKNEAIEKKEQEVQCEITDGMSNIELSVSAQPAQLPWESYNLPAQSILQMEQVYPATIMNIDGSSFWVITDDTAEVYNLMTEMTSYYKKNRTELTAEEVTSLTYCAYYDEETDMCYRGLFICMKEEEVAEVFLVDTGEVRTAKCGVAIQPLVPRFCVMPPYARCCHFAGVELTVFQDQAMIEKLEEFMQQHRGNRCSIEVDDNTSESLGVYVMLSDNETINNLLVKNGFAFITEKCVKEKPQEPEPDQLAERSHGATDPAERSHGPPGLNELSGSDISSQPEYEDPLEAVAGYSCRDEVDICKHYKGGAEKTCFKGARCKKRHVLLHPDGWTLDRVKVAVKVGAAPLPAPGRTLRAHVTCVCHFDRLYVQFDPDDDLEPEPKTQEFGVMMPPMTLTALLRDMNSPAARLAYKPLKMMPAPFELVAALYPLDDQWYRARVLSSSPADQNIEIQYIDYGNIVWVHEDAVRVLEPRFCRLAARATRAALAGVVAASHDHLAWAAAKRELARLAQDRTLDAHIVGRDYDEVTVELFDEEGYSIAQQLAALGLVALREYTVEDDTRVARKLHVPRP